MKKLASVAAALMVASLVVGCGGEPERGESSASATATPTSASSPASPAPTPTPTPTGPKANQIGEKLQLPSADITVDSIEQVEQVNGFDGPDKAKDGGRLWLVKITWTNNANEAVSKECHGPYSMDLAAFDINGVQMLEVDQPGFIEGNNCQTGLMKGQTGVWYTAFHSLDADFGWAAFDDYGGDVGYVVRDPNVTLSYVE